MEWDNEWSCIEGIMNDQELSGIMNGQVLSGIMNGQVFWAA